MALSDTQTLSLRKPLVLGTGPDAVTLSEVTLREPTAGEIEDASKEVNAISSNIRLIASVTGQPVQVVRRMAQRDFQAAVEYLQDFSDASPSTGEKSAQI